MPTDVPAFVSGVILLAILVAAAALIGWLAARLFLHASGPRPDLPDATAADPKGHR